MQFRSNNRAVKHEIIFILAINVGSVSTKVSVYKNKRPLVNETIPHCQEEFEGFLDVWDQYDFRKTIILDLLGKKGFCLEQFDVIASRGGVTKPIPSGIYRINRTMLADMKSKVYGSHPTNVGCQIAFDLGEQLKIPALTVDPPVTDEMNALARYSGIPQIQRQSSFHALSQRATARKAAAALGKPYDQVNLIVLHLGGGISIGAHKQARVVDVNNALNGDGPFSPERAGSLPTGELINLCFSGRYTKEEMYRLICGRGGLMAYLGTTDVSEIENRIRSGDQKAQEVFEAMGYQVAKEVGAAAVVLDGQVDAVVLTGNLARSKRLVNFIKSKTAFIAPFYLFPGENEMESLALGALRFMTGQEPARDY